MLIKNIHHIGYLVKDIEKSALNFENLGYIRENLTFDPIQKADILFMNLNGIKIELVAPQKNSQIYPLLKNYRDSPYHICYVVENINSAIYELQISGYMMFKEPVEAVAISANAKVAFLMKRNVGMIELVEL